MWKLFPFDVPDPPVKVAPPSAGKTHHSQSRRFLSKHPPSYPKQLRTQLFIITIEYHLITWSTLQCYFYGKLTRRLRRMKKKLKPLTLNKSLPVTNGSSLLFSVLRFVEICLKRSVKKPLPKSSSPAIISPVESLCLE